MYMRIVGYDRGDGDEDEGASKSQFTDQVRRPQPSGRER